MKNLTDFITEKYKVSKEAAGPIDSESKEYFSRFERDMEDELQRFCDDAGYEFGSEEDVDDVMDTFTNWLHEKEEIHLRIVGKILDKYGEDIKEWLWHNDIIDGY